MPGMNEIYRLRDSNAPLTLEVHIGHAGKSATIVKLHGSPQNGLFIDSFKYEIGPDQDLNGKDLEITALVSKIITGHKNSSLIITLKGGYEETSFPLHDDSDLNPVDYRATITLIM